MAIGFWLLSFINMETPEWLLGIWLFVTGAGVGLFLQVPTLAVQNSSDVRDLGTATAAISFFRSLGGTFGAAVLGSLLAARLAAHVAEAIPGAAPSTTDSLTGATGLSMSLPPEIAPKLLEAFALSFGDIFFCSIPFAVLSFVVALFLKGSASAERAL
jgi:hypothetical protein